MNMQEKNLKILLETIGNIELTPSERRSIEWLAGWESETINNICQVINKTKKAVKGK